MQSGTYTIGAMTTLYSRILWRFYKGSARDIDLMMAVMMILEVVPAEIIATAERTVVSPVLR